MRRILPLNARLIKKYRIAKGITVIQLAKKLKLSRATIYNYEIGIQMPNPKTLVKIAKILEVEPKDLISE
jgi:transcriptional regulator with XRE-family HTH domain